MASIHPSRLLTATTTATDLAADIGDSFGDIQIFTAAGMPVLFKDLWDQNEGIAVVSLMRHFGCFCRLLYMRAVLVGNGSCGFKCWELAAQLKEAMPKFEAAGVKLIAVGVGTPDKARVLAERLPFPMDTLYADPDRKAYDVMGLYFGIRRTFFSSASKNIWARLQSTRKSTNYTIAATPRDKSGVLQQGGMLVFKGKQLVYAWKDEGAGDHAPLDDVFNVCCNVPAA
ncbi:hypothetical protein ACFE04_000921 [Oxalis oulophora]